ncbi:MAG: dCTP deaminase [Stellaceae bacterium]
MILTDREIKTHLERGTIIIDPRPTAYDSTSCDLTLDPIISEFTKADKGLETTIDPVNANFKDEEILRSITKRITLDEDGYVLKPDDFILGWTAEYINLKYDARIAARVEGKSSLARLGVVIHMTAPTIHAGFEGQIRLEIANYGRFPIRFRPRMRVCQLIFEMTLGAPEKAYQEQFAGQTSGS